MVGIAPLEVNRLLLLVQLSYLSLTSKSLLPIRRANTECREIQLTASGAKLAPVKLGPISSRRASRFDRSIGVRENCVTTTRTTTTATTSTTMTRQQLWSPRCSGSS